MLEHRLYLVAPLFVIAACSDESSPGSTETSGDTTSAATDDATGDGPGEDASTTADDPASTSTSTDASASGSTTSDGSTSSDASTDDSSSTGEPAGERPSSGCGAAGQPDVLSGSIVVGGTMRTFVIEPPDGYDASTPYPLVFGFHGAYDSGAGARLGYRLADHWDGEAIVVYPDALPHGGVTRWESNPGSADHDFVLALRDAIAEQMCVDEARVFSFGYSSGGYMTNALACAHGDLFRGAGPIAGGMTAQACTDPVAVFAAHGESDSTVPFSAGLAARDRWLEVNGCSNTSTPTGMDGCVSYDGCAEGHPVVWCTYPGGHQFHGWTAAAAVEMFRNLPY